MQKKNSNKFIVKYCMKKKIHEHEKSTQSNYFSICVSVYVHQIMVGTFNP